MNEMQNRVLKKFVKILGKKTFSEYANIIGIEKTRMFRIFNGLEMKISEYEKMSCYVSAHSPDGELENQLYSKFGNNFKQTWKLEVQRKYELHQLLKSA